MWRGLPALGPPPDRASLPTVPARVPAALVLPAALPAASVPPPVHARPVRLPPVHHIPTGTPAQLRRPPRPRPAHRAGGPLRLNPAAGSRAAHRLDQGVQ